MNDEIIKIIDERGGSRMDSQEELIAFYKAAYNAGIESVKQESVEPVAKVVKASGSLKDIHIINWMNEYSPNEGDLLYDHPAQSRDDNEPTYGQLKIRLENANKTIEMQRCELFNLRDANYISRDSIIEECAKKCEYLCDKQMAAAIRGLKGK